MRSRTLKGLGEITIVACATAGCGIDVEGTSLKPPPSPSPCLVTTAWRNATVCPRGEITRGIDVSEYQGEINWAKVAGDDVAFVFVRANGKDRVKDKRFDTNWASAKAQGLTRGAYQYFRPQYDALEQAKLFLSIVGELEATDLPPVLDVEEADGKNPVQIAAAMRVWLAHVAQATGRRPIIYTGRGFWDAHLTGQSFGNYKLWHAQYPSPFPTAAACPKLPAGWSAWAFWQVSQTGRVAGIAGDVDIDRYNGTMAQMQAELGGDAPAPPTCP